MPKKNNLHPLSRPSSPEIKKKPSKNLHWIESQLKEHLDAYPGAEPRVKAAMQARWIDQCIFFDKKAVRNQLFDQRLKMTAIAAGLISTALGPALASNAPMWLGWIVAAAGIVVTATTQIQDTFKPRQLHENARKSCELISTEIWSLIFGIDAYQGKSTEKAISLCAQRIEQINANNMAVQFTPPSEADEGEANADFPMTRYPAFQASPSAPTAEVARPVDLPQGDLTQYP